MLFANIPPLLFVRIRDSLLLTAAELLGSRPVLIPSLATDWFHHYQHSLIGVLVRNLERLFYLRWDRSTCSGNGNRVSRSPNHDCLYYCSVNPALCPDYWAATFRWNQPRQKAYHFENCPWTGRSSWVEFDLTNRRRFHPCPRKRHCWNDYLMGCYCPTQMTDQMGRCFLCQ